MADEATGTVSTRRKKEPLKPGHTLVDWARLCAMGKVTNGLAGQQRKVAPSELATHNQPHDAWVVLNGRVYNITPYLDFHPGGVSILTKVAGKDATRLFNATHQWVNGESLLRTCLVGPLVPEQPKAEDKEAVPKQQQQQESADGEAIDTSFPAPDGPQVAKRPSS